MATRTFVCDKQHHTQTNLTTLLKPLMPLSPHFLCHGYHSPAAAVASRPLRLHRQGVRNAHQDTLRDRRVHTAVKEERQRLMGEELVQVHRFLDEYADDDDALANADGYASDDDDDFFDCESSLDSAAPCNDQHDNAAIKIHYVIRVQ